jgi:hypothetical protein
MVSLRHGNVFMVTRQARHVVGQVPKCRRQRLVIRSLPPVPDRELRELTRTEGLEL